MLIPRCPNCGYKDIRVLSRESQEARASGKNDRVEEEHRLQRVGLANGGFTMVPVRCCLGFTLQ